MTTKLKLCQQKLLLVVVVLKRMNINNEDTCSLVFITIGPLH